MPPAPFEPISQEAFRRFHADFHGESWDICNECGGKCEISKIGSLMPGEAEFIAADLKVPVDDFRRRFLDGIDTGGAIVDVLKLKPGCPFLSPSFRCTIPEVKVVLCDVYPVVFDVSDGAVEFSLDEWCPIVRYEPPIAEHFRVKGIPALEALGVPARWYEAVSAYDSLCVDYTRFARLRGDALDYRVFTLDEIKSCVATDAPPPELPRRRYLRVLQ